MKISRAKRQINYVGDSRHQQCRAFFEKQVGMGSESDCLLEQLNRILQISDSEVGLKVEKLGGVFGEEGECGDDDVELLVRERERRSLDILSVKKEARLSARALAEV